MSEIEVMAGSRLHFGLLCAAQGKRWHYGGIGMMLDQPQWHIQIGFNQTSEADNIDASDGVNVRISNIVNTYRRLHGRLPAISVTAKNEATMHAGLGAGTQLTLAIASALQILERQTSRRSAANIAEDFGRSRRSAIGTYGFDHGGFIVDYGRSLPENEQIRRLRFPEEWRMVLMTPQASAGLFGETEESFFGKPDTLDDRVVQKLETIVEREISVGLDSIDFQLFREGLAAYGNLAGEFYASAQGGIFSSPVLRTIARWLEKQNITGAVQSSWGPTICIPTASEQDAEQLIETIKTHASATSIDLRIARGMNVGATIKSNVDDNQRSFG
ncbi:MAG: hypothetical protein WAO83_10565 [Fuerstiella sp.]|mgnify:CR=1 FL=1